MTIVIVGFLLFIVVWVAWTQFQLAEDALLPGPVESIDGIDAGKM